MRRQTIVLAFLSLCLIWTSPCLAAITLVATPTVTTPNTAQTGTVALPASITGDDIILQVIDSNSSTPPTITTTVGSVAKTFVKIGQTAVTNDGWTGYMLRRISDGSETTSITVDAGATFGLIGIVGRVYSGESQSTPENGGTSTNVAVTGTSATVSGVTTSAGSEVVFMCWDLARAVTFTTPAGFGNAALDTAESYGSWDKSNTGATGTISSGTMTSGDTWGAMAFAITPAAAGGPPKGVLIMSDLDSFIHDLDLSLHSQYE